MSSPILSTATSGHTRVLSIDRSAVHNALNRAVLAELDAAIADAIADSRTRAVVLTGEGERAFSAGADLDELAGLSGVEAHDLLRAGQQVFRRIELSTVPIIAAVNGLALGGGFELVLATTFPVLAEGATLGLPEAGLGLMPGYGGTQRLTRLVGPQVARYVMLAGRRLTAARAYQLGLTPLEPVPDGDAVDVALDFAGRLSSTGPNAVRSILEATRVAGDAPADVGFALESALAGLATAGPEAVEGIAAFRERRTPVFDRATTRGEP